MPNPIITEITNDIARWEREVGHLWRRFAEIPPLAQSTIDSTLVDGELCWSQFTIQDSESNLSFSELVQCYLGPAERALAQGVDNRILELIYNTLSGTNRAPFLPRFRRGNTQDNLRTAKRILNNHEAPLSARNLIMGIRSETDILMSGHHEDILDRGFNDLVSPHLDSMSQGLSIAWAFNALRFKFKHELRLQHIQWTGTEVTLGCRFDVSILNPLWIILFQDR